MCHEVVQERWNENINQDLKELRLEVVEAVHPHGDSRSGQAQGAQPLSREKDVKLL